MVDVIERFLSHTERDPETGCLVWTGATDKDGYGVFQFEGRAHKAHRWHWQYVNGQVADDLQVRHRCDNPPCVDLDHLLPGTRSDNVRDSVERGRFRNQHTGKTHCPHNHPYDEENTYVDPRGWRHCRTCNRQARHH